MMKNPTKVCANPLTAERACKAALLILRRWYARIQNDEKMRRNVMRLRKDDSAIVKRQNEINEEKLDDDERRTKMLQVDLEKMRNEVNENLENELKELQGSEIGAAGC